jgi:hypothetical protein
MAALIAFPPSTSTLNDDTFSIDDEGTWYLTILRRKNVV